MINVINLTRKKSFQPSKGPPYIHIHTLFLFLRFICNLSFKVSILISNFYISDSFFILIRGLSINFCYLSGIKWSYFFNMFWWLKLGIGSTFMFFVLRLRSNYLPYNVRTIDTLLLYLKLFYSLFFCYWSAL